MEYGKAMIIINTIKLINGDCLDKLKQIKDKSVNLVLIDPPYNISKADWDMWKTVDEYIEFMGQVFLECERVLKDNGSFYFFHNDFEQMAELQHWIKKNTKFIFKSLITWDKLTNADTVQIGSLAKGYGNLRNYFSGSTSEYCVFYTLQEMDLVLLNQRDYLMQEWKKSKLTIKQIKELCGFTGNQPYNWFSPNNQGTGTWQLPKEEHYIKLQSTGYWQKSYQDLKNEFNDKRYTFNKPSIKIKGTKLDELKNNLRNITTVWNFDRPKNNYKLGHITPKPVNMIKHIIEVSSKEGDLVLDCFMGSGTCAEACLHTNRNFIGIELDSGYFETCKNRTSTYIKENNLQDVNVEIA